MGFNLPTRQPSRNSHPPTPSLTSLDRKITMPAEIWIRWTIRLSMGLYALYLLLSLTQPEQIKVRRGLWTAACLAFLAHFLAAFQFAHAWSHQHALHDTAQQTGELMGWELGEGIYFSYLFLAIWLLDTAWWWLAKYSYSTRPAWLSWLVQGYILFIAANGCIVFESGITRWGGLLIGLFLLAILIAKRWSRRTEPANE